MNVRRRKKRCPTWQWQNLLARVPLNHPDAIVSGLRRGQVVSKGQIFPTQDQFVARVLGFGKAASQF